MKAIKYMKYGSPDVINIIETDKPLPKENEVIVKIFNSSMSPTECAFRSAKPFVTRLFAGFFSPRATPGDCLSGVIHEIGSNVSNFKVGDRVFGTTGPKMGAHAQFARLDASDAIVALPDNLTFEDGAAISDGAITALPFIRDHGKVQSGQHVLINGASGSIGTYAISLCKELGASVTAVCSSKNHQLVKDLGADYVIDYHKEDFTSNKNTYDVIFDTVGKSSFKKSKNSLTSSGVYLTTVPALPEMIHTLLFKNPSKKTAIFAATGLRKEKDKIPDLIYLANLAKNNKLKTVIDRKFIMDDIRKAHDYVEKGHKVGNVTLIFND